MVRPVCSSDLMAFPTACSKNGSSSCPRKVFISRWRAPSSDTSRRRRMRRRTPRTMSPTEKHASDAAASDRADSMWDISLNLPRKRTTCPMSAVSMRRPPTRSPCTYSYTAKPATLSQNTGAGIHRRPWLHMNVRLSNSVARRSRVSRTSRQ